MNFETNFRQHLTWGCVSGLVYGVLRWYATGSIFQTMSKVQTVLITTSFYMLHVQGSVQPDLDLHLPITSWPDVKKLWMYLTVGLVYIHLDTFGTFKVVCIGAKVGVSLMIGCVVAVGLHVAYLIDRADRTASISSVIGVAILARLRNQIPYATILRNVFRCKLRMAYVLIVTLQHVCLNGLPNGTHRKSMFHNTGLWSCCNCVALLCMVPNRVYNTYAMVLNVLYFNSFGVLNHLLLDHFGSIFTRKIGVNTFYQIVGAIVVAIFISVSTIIYVLNTMRF